MATHHISTLVKDSPPLPDPPASRSDTERTLPAKFCEGFLTDGPGWSSAERAIAATWRAAARDMAADMRDGELGWTLALLGQTATGKTMLGKMVLKYARVLHVRNPPLYRFGEPPPGPSRIYWPTHTWQLVEELTPATFLLLDEIGRGERGGKEWSRFLDLLNFRTERRLFTVITANLTFEELRKIDPAIASRLRRNGGRAFNAGVGIRPFEDRK